MSGVGRSPKTNMGGQMQKQSSQLNAGSPNLDQQRSAVGTVTDIRMPGEFRPREGSGILVQIHFDQEEYRTSTWLSLKDDYHYVISNIGNRQAILKNPPRVMYHFNPIRFAGGYAELICDNKLERNFDTYARNNSAVFVNAISGLASNARAPG